MHADTKALVKRRQDSQDELERLKLALENTEVDISEDEGDPDFVEREKLVALMSNVEQHIQEIDAALEMEANGAYGICESCNEPIDPERLAIMPEATLCVKCKELAERQRQMRNRRQAQVIVEE